MTNEFGDRPVTNEFGDTPSGAVAAGPGAPDAMERLFGGVDHMDAALPSEGVKELNAATWGESDPTVAKIQAVNLAFLAHTYGKEPREIAPTVDLYRRDYASQVLGTSETLDDGAFYARVGSFLQRKKAERVMLNDFLGAIYEGVRKGSDINAVFEEQRKARAGDPGWDSANQAFYREFARENWQRFETTAHQLQKPIDAVTAYMTKTTRRPEGTGRKMEEDAAATVHLRDLALDALTGLSEEEAHFVMGFAASRAAKNTPLRGLGEKMLQRVGRGFERVAAVTNLIDDLGRRIFDTKEEAEAGRRRADLQRKLDQFISGEVDPARANGWLANGVLSAAETGPKLATMLSVPGIAANTLSRFQELRGEFADNGVTEGKAAVLASIAVVPETALNFANAKLVFGSVPRIGGLFAPIKAEAGLAAGALSRRFLALAGVEAGLQTALAGGQQLLPTAVQSLASALDDEIPGRDWGKELRFMRDAAPETLASLLPFVLVGAGAATFKDRAYGLEYLKRETQLRALGLQEADTVRVLGASTPEEASSAISDGISRSSETPHQKAAILALNREALRAREALGHGFTPEQTALIEKHGDVFSSIPPNHIPIEIRQADGTVIPAVFNGYWDLADGTPPRPSVGYRTETGWSHGSVGMGADRSEVITPLPTPEEWARGVRSPGGEPPPVKITRPNGSTFTVLDENGMPVATSTSPEEAAAAAHDALAARAQREKTADAPAEGGFIAGSELEKWADRYLKEASGQLYAGLDPVLLTAYAVKGAVLLERGLRDFADWSKEMVAQFGEKIRPHLEDIFASSQNAAKLQKKNMAMVAPSKFAEIIAETRTRRVSERVIEQDGPAAKFAGEVRDALTNTEYIAVGLGDIQDDVARVLGRGEASAAQAFYDESSEMPLSTRVGLGLALAEHYNSQRQYDLAAHAIDRSAELGTELGQAVNAFKLLGIALDSPEKAIGYAQAQRSKMTQRITRKPEVDAAVEELTKLANERKANASQLDRLRDQMEKLTTLLNEGTTAQIADAIVPKSRNTSDEIANLQAMIARTKEALRAELSTPLDRYAQKLSVLRAKIEENVRLLNEGTTEEIRAKLGKKPSVIEPADLAELKRIYADSRSALERSITDPVDFEKRLMDRMKARGLETPDQVKQALSKIINLADEGRLSEKSVREVIASKYKIPGFTEQQLGQIGEKAQRIARLPKDSAYRTDATIELMNEIHDTLKPVSFMDAAWSVWYGNILSGYNTTLRNISGNAFELLSSWSIDAFWRDPRQWLTQIHYAVQAGKKGFALGVDEGLFHLKTGRAMVGRAAEDKFSTSDALERRSFAGGAKNPYNLVKYVKRFLAAQDAVNFHTGTELKAIMAADEMARAEFAGRDFDEPTVQRRVEELLNYADEQQKSFHNRAETEWAALRQGDVQGTKEQYVKRRVAELTTQERNGALVERATNFGARVTYNYQPEGVLGSIASAIGAMNRGVPEEQVSALGAKGQALKALSQVSRFVVPFARVSANVLNRQLDWVIGAPRSILPWTFHYEGGRLSLLQKMADDRATELRKGVIGLTTGLALHALTRPRDDEDQGIQIHGPGPKEATKREQLAALGWKPWSVQIGGKFYTYKFLPPGLLLGMVGIAHDQERYSNWSDQGYTERLSYFGGGAGAYMLDQSYLSNLGNLMGAMAESDPKARVKRLESFMNRTFSAKAAVPFSNLLQNLTNDIDSFKRDRNGAMGWMTSQVPVASAFQRPAVNILGEPVQNVAFDAFVGRKYVDQDSERIFRMIARKKAFASDVFQYKSKMTPDEFYAFSVERGSLLKEMLLGRIDELEGMTDPEAQRLVKQLSALATKRAWSETSAPSSPAALAVGREE